MVGALPNPVEDDEGGFVGALPNPAEGAALIEKEGVGAAPPKPVEAVVLGVAGDGAVLPKYEVDGAALEKDGVGAALPNPVEALEVGAGPPKCPAKPCGTVGLAVWFC